MIALLLESDRYLPDVVAVSANYKEMEDDTPFGLMKYFSGKIGDEEFIYFTDNGVNPNVDLIHAPLGIAHILFKYKIKKLVLIAKVGGINSLLSVGDVLVIDDYLDATVFRKRSYYRALDPTVNLTYEMSEPFCPAFTDYLYSICRNVKNEHPVLNNIYKKGRFLCTEGPSFESRSEISLYKNNADVVAHCIVPYVYIFKELGICFGAVGIVSNICLEYGGSPGEAFLANDRESIKAFANLSIQIIKKQNLLGTCMCSSDSRWLQKPELKVELSDV